MTKPTPEQVRAFAELVRCVRTAMILDVMHEFIASEAPNCEWLATIWYMACDKNQQELEELFAAIALGYLEIFAADDKAGDAPTK